MWRKAVPGRMSVESWHLETQDPVFFRASSQYKRVGVAACLLLCKAELNSFPYGSKISR